MEEMLGLSKDARGDEELKRKIRTDGIDEIESVEEDDYDDDTFASGERFLQKKRKRKIRLWQI